MAAVNIRVFKGLNNVTDPSFLDETGGHLVWAENVDFSSGKIRPLPDSEVFLSSELAQAEGAFTVGKAEVSQGRGNFWYYDELFTATPWAQGDSLFWFVQNQDPGELKSYLVYSGLEFRVPFSDYTTGYLYKELGVVKPVKQIPGLNFGTDIYSIHPNTFTPNYALSYLQNFLGFAEESGLTFFQVPETLGKTYDLSFKSVYSTGVDSLETSSEEGIAPYKNTTSTSGHYTSVVGLDPMGEASLVTTRSYSRGLGATVYDLTSAPAFDQGKGQITIRLYTDWAFWVENVFYSSVYKGVNTATTAPDECITFFSTPVITLLSGTGYLVDGALVGSDALDSSQSVAVDDILALYDLVSGRFVIFKALTSLAADTAGTISVRWLSESEALVADILDPFPVAGPTLGGRRNLYRVSPPEFKFLAHSSESAETAVLTLAEQFNLAHLRAANIPSAFQLDHAYAWDNTDLSNLSRLAIVSSIPGGTVPAISSIDVTPLFYNNGISFTPSNLQLGGPGDIDFSAISASAPDFRLLAGSQTKLRNLYYSEISGYAIYPATVPTDASFFLATDPDSLVYSKLILPDNLPENVNGEGQDVFPMGYTTHQNIYRLFNGEYLLAERIPLWTPGVAGGLEDSTFTVDLTGGPLETDSAYHANRPAFLVFTTGDIVKYTGGVSNKFYRYLGAREFSFPKGSADSFQVTFKDTPSETLTNQIESLFLDGTRVNSDYWELVTNIVYNGDQTIDWYDTILDEDLGDQSDSFFTSSTTGALVNYGAPPGSLDGIADSVYANMVFGWKGSRLYWSETLLPNSWSEAFFFHNFSDEIAGVVAGAEQITVVTKTSTHTSNSRDPENMTFYDVANIGALGKYAVANWKGSPVFLSQVGLILFQGGKYTNLTEQFLLEDVFRASVEKLTNREFTGTRDEGPCVGVSNDLIYFHLPNSGTYVYSLKLKELATVKMPNGPDGLPLSVKMFHSFYEDKVVAVSAVSTKIIYTNLLDAFNAPPGLAYSEYTIHSADLDIGRTDWKNFESLQFQGSGKAEVSFVGASEMISTLSNQDPETNSTGEGFVFPVVISTHSSSTSDVLDYGDQIIPQSSDLTGTISIGDILHILPPEVVSADQWHEFFEVQDIDASQIILDRPVPPVEDATADPGSIYQHTPGTGVEGDLIRIPQKGKDNSGAVQTQVIRNWVFQSGAIIVVKDTSAVIGRKYYEYKGDKVLTFSDPSLYELEFNDTPSATQLESVLLPGSVLNSAFWKESSCLARQKIFDINDQYGSELGQGSIGDTVSLPAYNRILTGDILHGKLRNGRQFWAQYLGAPTIWNNSAATVKFPMVKALSGAEMTAGVSLVQIPAVCIYEDQIYEPYRAVFPYQGHSIDFTTLDGSRVGVPFDFPTDRLSFIIKGTGKIIGVTVNGF